MKVIDESSFLRKIKKDQERSRKIQEEKFKLLDYLSRLK